MTLNSLNFPCFPESINPVDAARWLLGDCYMTATFPLDHLAEFSSHLAEFRSNLAVS
jgi:hypothetical protein